MQCFRRELFIVLAAGVSEARLLCTLVGLRWPGGFGLQGARHALLPPFLLRAPRFNTLMTDADREPPHGEFAQAAVAEHSRNGDSSRGMVDMGRRLVGGAE